MLFRSLYSLGFGLGLGWLRRRTGSIWPGVLLHGLNNCCLLYTSFDFGSITELTDGIQQLNSAMDQLLDGASQLVDGAAQLAEMCIRDRHCSRRYNPRRMMSYSTGFISSSSSGLPSRMQV